MRKGIDVNDVEPGTPGSPRHKIRETSTNHAIIFRFTFPKSERSNILFSVFDAGRLSFTGNNVLNGQGHLRGYQNSLGIREGKTLYFYAEFNRPIAFAGTWRGDTVGAGTRNIEGNRIGAFAGYSTSGNEQVELKVGISASSIEDARSVLEKEIPDWNFDRTKSQTKSLWNKALGLITVQGGTENQLETFYTALYRTMGQKSNVWNAYRCAYPLQTIIDPSLNMKIIRKFVRDYEKTGWLPSSQAMIGNHTAAVITDAYMKGLRDFNVQEAYAGMRKNATEATMIPWRDEGHITELEKCYFDKGYYPALPVKPDMKVEKLWKKRAKPTGVPSISANITSAPCL